MQVVRYHPGEFYRPHHDSSSNITLRAVLAGGSAAPKRATAAFGRRLEFRADRVFISKRTMTAFLYLNEVPNGGGATRFPLIRFAKSEGRTESERLAFTPQRGMLVLWANVRYQKPEYAHNAMIHEACNVTRGVKYGANFWIH
eukprot:1459932-Prymnesium_polylepis.1